MRLEEGVQVVHCLAEGDGGGVGVGSDVAEGGKDLRHTPRTRDVHTRRDAQARDVTHVRTCQKLDTAHLQSQKTVNTHTHLPFIYN